MAIIVFVFPGGERNAVGAGVWKRVRLKLEGRDDSQTARRYALHDQVCITEGGSTLGRLSSVGLCDSRSFPAGGAHDQGSCLL